MRRFRAEARTLRGEQERLAGILEELSRLESELEGARSRLADSEARRERTLASIRSDRRRREIALGELSETATRLADLIENVGATGAEPPELDARKFKGLMTWPATGRVRAGFGTRIHPASRRGSRTRGSTWRGRSATTSGRCSTAPSSTPPGCGATG